MQGTHALGGALIAVLASAAAAQLEPVQVPVLPGVRPDPGPASTLSSPTSLPGDTPSASLRGRGTDVAFGDLDRDGWTDLVVARKQPSAPGNRRTNALLINTGGLLEDRSAEYASASDVPGDRGFLTPTNDRDVFIADLDDDGWLDVVTAAAPGDGDPKQLGHPRIYMNLGLGAAGAWLGLRHEDARMPQLVSFSSGLPWNPRCCSVSLGDVNGDGFADLCLGDREAGGADARRGDRLLINDGNGYFADQSELRRTSDLLLSDFSRASIIADFDGDGVNDAAGEGALFPPDATMRPAWESRSFAPGAAPAAPSGSRASAPTAGRSSPSPEKSRRRRRPPTARRASAPCAPIRASRPRSAVSRAARRTSPAPSGSCSRCCCSPAWASSS
jgi:hypothetical protein